MTDANPFPEWLRGRLAELGLGQRELARRLGLSQGTTSKWMIGRAIPTVRFLKPLARELQVGLEELVDRIVGHD